MINQNNMEFQELSLIEIRNELKEAAQLTDMNIRFEMDLDKTFVSMKVSPKFQRLDIHTEHHLLITMVANKFLTFEEHCALLIKKMWEKNERNYFKCLSDIQDEYETFKSKFND